MVCSVESGEIGRVGVDAVVVVAAGGGAAPFAGDDGRAVAGEEVAGVGAVTSAERGEDAAVAPPTSVRSDEP